MSVSEYWYIKAFKDGQLYLANLKPFEFEYSTVIEARAMCKFGDGSGTYVQDVLIHKRLRASGP